MPTAISISPKSKRKSSMKAITPHETE